MLRLALLILGLVLFILAGLDLISTSINGLKPAALVAFGLASITGAAIADRPAAP